MIPINKNLFDLSEVYSNWKQQDTWFATGTLRGQRQELIDCLRHIANVKLFEGHYKQEEEAIREQLAYVDKNLRTLEDALLCHETKCFEKRPSLGDHAVFGLN